MSFNKAGPPPAYPKRDSEAIEPPSDAVSALVFSPAAIPEDYLIAGSWDHTVSFRSVKM